MNRPVVVLAVVLIAAGCGDEATSPSAVVSTLEIVSGDSQTDTVTRLLHEPLIVRALTAAGRPIQGLVVHFSVTRGRGSVFSMFDVTDRDGEAHERWTLGSVAGKQEVTARTVSGSTGDTITATFVATALPDSIAHIAVWPDPQAEARGDTIVVATSLQFFANAFDRFGNVYSDSRFMWIVSDTSVARVSLNGGLFSPVTDGEVAVTAQKEGMIGADTVCIWLSPRSRLALALAKSGETNESGDYLEVPDAPSLNVTTTWTLEAWIKPRNAGANEKGRIISKGTYELSVVRNHLKLILRGESSNSSVESSASIFNGVWQHVAVSFNHDTLIFYLNGVPESATSGLVAPAARPTTLRFAHINYNYRGLLDEVRLWNVTRTPQEIAAAMNREIDPDEPGLVGYWRLNDGSGDRAVDLTQFHNDGWLGSAVGPDEHDPRWTTESAPISPQGGSQR